MKRRYLGMALAFVVALLLVPLTSQIASAHEKRLVGNYTFVVGFLNEPAYANTINSLDLTICNGNSCNYTVQDGSRVLANPVNDADKTLKAEVRTGGAAPLALPLEARWGNPGKYVSYFQPVKTGAYTFHISGTLNNDKIDEKFTSGPNTFGEVETVTSYPAVSQHTDQTATDVKALKDQVKQADAKASTATTVGIAGAVLGVLGLIAAAVTLTRSNKAAISSTVKQKEPVESRLG